VVPEQEAKRHHHDGVYSLDVFFPPSAPAITNELVNMFLDWIRLEEQQQTTYNLQQDLKQQLRDEIVYCLLVLLIYISTVIML